MRAMLYVIQLRYHLRFCGVLSAYDLAAAAGGGIMLSLCIYYANT